MADAFDGIVGQPKVRDFLRATVASDRIIHAYLFTGPAGSNKTQAAFAFAQAILCPKGPSGPRGGQCGSCDICRKVARRTHPDVVYVAPEGAGGYLVGQVRDLIASVAMAPIQAKRKVYIVDRADLLSVQAANAFLKTLEEPPEDVVIVLLARTAESVLPTIASRCQTVPFRTIPQSEACALVVQNSGASASEARRALAACDGSIERAVGLLGSTEQRSFRGRVLAVLGCLERSDDWDVVGYGRELLGLVKLPDDTLQAKLQEQLDENRDFLSKSAIRQLEERNKRQITAKTTAQMRMLGSVARSWLRDVMVCSAGQEDLVVNDDVAAQIRSVAVHGDTARAAAALAAVDRFLQAIPYNVSPETNIDSLLFEIRRCLFAR